MVSTLSTSTRTNARLIPSKTKRQLSSIQTKGFSSRLLLDLWLILRIISLKHSRVVASILNYKTALTPSSIFKTMT
eukprot:13313466-Ditylum_brightwellii.AAC.1